METLNRLLLYVGVCENEPQGAALDKVEVRKGIAGDVDVDSPVDKCRYSISVRLNQVQ